MPINNLKNNKGSSPVVFIILLSILILVFVGVGIFYLGYSATKQKTIRQINQYTTKRQEITKKYNEIPKFELKESILEKSISILKNIKSDFQEVEKSELPEEIKNELKDCHLGLKKDIELNINFYEFNLNIVKRKSELNQNEVDRISKFDEEFKENNQKTIEDCKKAETKIQEILKSKGIVISKE